MLAKLFSTITLALFLTGCPSNPGTPDPIVPPNPPPDTDWCATMCLHLSRMGCEEGGPVYNNDLPGLEGIPNQSCADNCVELQDRGFFVNPKCVVDAPSCEEVEDYRQHEPDSCNPQTGQ
jgi:hypothetical protein